MRLGVALPIVDIGGEPEPLREFVQRPSRSVITGLRRRITFSASMSRAAPVGTSRAPDRAIFTTTRSCCSGFSPGAPRSPIFPLKY